MNLSFSPHTIPLFWKLSGRSLATCTRFRCALIAMGLGAGQLASAAEDPFAKVVLPLLETHCYDCHEGDKPKGDADLGRFLSEADAMQDRDIWRLVFEKIESHQMPPPKRKSQMSESERQLILAWVEDFAGRPLPQLAARDPGKPVLRRLTRLEYNNTVRDALGMDTDVFMFPERLLLVDRTYFVPAAEQLPNQLVLSMRDSGRKSPALLPRLGLPGDNRAEHGFRNRGDANNLSPLLLEQFMSMAKEIAQHPALLEHSRVFAWILGQPQALPWTSAAVEMPDPRPASSAPEITPKYAHDPEYQEFHARWLQARPRNQALVLDAEDFPDTTLVSGESLDFSLPGGVLHWSFGGNIWMPSTTTLGAEKTVPDSLVIANQDKNAKRWSIAFDGDIKAGSVKEVGFWLVPRKKGRGEMRASVELSNGQVLSKAVIFEREYATCRWMNFTAPAGSFIQRLRLDGTDYPGYYMAIDDVAVILEEGRLPISKTRESDADSVESRLMEFANRVLRQPLMPEQKERFTALYRRVKTESASEEIGVRAVLQALLSSPAFLYLSEPSQPNQPAVRALTGHEIAARLSYFLWASEPDAELRALADSGELVHPERLDQQTQRMLRDPKSKELSEGFAVQWLRLDQLYSTQPDKTAFNPFYPAEMGGNNSKSTLHSAMMIEALLLFETVMVENRSLLDFIDARYSWLNSSLAQVYGVPTSVALPTPADGTIKSEQQIKFEANLRANLWVRSDLPNRTRGGFLTMGGPLVVTSLPTRTSPVKRGAWILETIFNRPPQEPKIAFAIEDKPDDESKSMTLRQRFEAHRSNSNCFTCHIRLDPPGFALETFDAIGISRERDGDQLVDAQASWQGAEFDGPAEFKDILAQKPGEFVRGFIEHLLSYALMRELTLDDIPTVKEIQHTVTEDHYRFQTVVREIVQSYPFRHTRNSDLEAE